MLFLLSYSLAAALTMGEDESEAGRQDFDAASLKLLERCQVPPTPPYPPLPPPNHMVCVQVEDQGASPAFRQAR